jgi:hypothetical protein
MPAAKLDATGRRRGKWSHLNWIVGKRGTPGLRAIPGFPCFEIAATLVAAQ